MTDCDICSGPLTDDQQRRHTKRCSPACQREWRNRRTRRYYAEYRVPRRDIARAKYHEDVERGRAATKAWREANPDKARLGLLRRRLATYGLTVEEWQALHDAQGGACAICQRTEAKLVVDHDHRTGVVRGLLCNRCNGVLGFIEDEVLMAAATDYLAQSARRRLEVA
jgi:hypothetical protein